MDPKRPTCITCGLPAGELPGLNRLENGAGCPTCRDRLLELLPPIFPGGEGGCPVGESEQGAGGASAARPVGPQALVPVRRRKSSSTRPPRR